MSTGIINILRRFVSRLGDAIFPAVCECCGRSLVDGEQFLCLHCLHDLPRTNYHKDSFNELHKRLAAPKVPIENAASMFHYIKDSRFALLVQRAKYNNRPIIIRHLAIIFAKELYKEHFFDDINLILPIPLHWRKKLKRGFNQSEEIAKSIGGSLTSPSYLVRNRTLGPPLENNPEIPPSSRDEGLRLLHGLRTNLATSLQTPQEA